MADQHTVEYVGSARAYRHTATGLSASPDAPRLSGLSKDEADDLVSTGQFERVSESDPESTAETGGSDAEDTAADDEPDESEE